ncbi:MAG TPA: hypothetical protein PLI31_04080 [Methanoregulaceae archaeon]|nr:hypothetical protein [Methanoregulaceae archaeon]
MLLVLIVITSTVTAASVSGISRTSGEQGKTYTNVYVYGSGFVPGTQVALMRTGAAVYATSEVLVSSSIIRCTLTIPASQATGLYGVVVQVPGQTTWNGKANAFTVTPAPIAPVVTGISPNKKERGSTFTAVITGKNFKAGSKVALEVTGGTPVYYGTSVTTLSSTQIRCTFTLPSNAPLGYYNVYVQDPVFKGNTNGWVYGRNLFQVIQQAPSAPVVTGISPNKKERGSTFTAVITGKNFKAGSKVALEVTGGTPVYYGTSVTTLSSTQIRCTFTLPSNAPLGYYNVYVQDPVFKGNTNGWVYGRNLFQVIDAVAPVVTGISPTSHVRGSTFTATVYGKNFRPGSEVALEKYGGAAVYYATGETWLSANAIRFTITVPSNAPLGYYSVYVKDPVFKGGTNGWVYGREIFRVDP